MSREMMMRYGLRPALPQPLRSLGTEPRQIGSDHDWKGIEAGDSHFLALKTDGTLWAWGINGIGQLGDGTTENRDQPVRIGGDTNWAQVAGGQLTSTAVKRDGSLWLWGHVELSDKKTGTRYVSFCAPRRVGDSTSWVSAAGFETHAGNQADGSLRGFWSQTFYGWSTNPAPPPPEFPVSAMEAVEFGNGWVQFAFGPGRFVGLKEDGSLWGSEMARFNLNRIPFPASRVAGGLFLRDPPVRKSYQKPWIAVAAGRGDSSVALAADGSLWTWGQQLDRPGPRLISASNRPHLVARLAEPGAR